MSNYYSNIVSISRPSLIFLLEFRFLVGEGVEEATRMGICRQPNSSIKPVGILRAGEEIENGLEKEAEQKRTSCSLRIGGSLPEVFSVVSHASLRQSCPAGSHRGWEGQEC